MAIKAKPKSFHYTVGVRWSGEKRGTMSAAGKPDVEVASPPEFKGHPGVWTPEDLLVSAVNACTLMTFLSFAARKEIEVVSYESDATGTLEMADGAFRFTRVVVHPRIVVADRADCERALTAFHDAKAACLVSNSLVSAVEGEPEISVR